MNMEQPQYLSGLVDIFITGIETKISFFVWEWSPLGRDGAGGLQRFSVQSAGDKLTDGKQSDQVVRVTADLQHQVEM